MLDLTILKGKLEYAMLHLITNMFIKKEKKSGRSEKNMNY